MRAQLDRRFGRFAFWTVLVTAACLVPRAAHAQSCVGDCNGDATVSLNELIVGVGIALGTRPITDCERLDANSDETISIDELIAAVSQSFSPCATPTITATRTPSATASPTRSATATPSFTPTPTDTSAPTETETTTPTSTPTVALLRRASKSSSIALSGDESVLVMANPDDHSVSIFRTADNTLFSKVDTGNEPSAVVIHPDDSTAFVANRASATVVKINDIKSPAPGLAAVAQVGSEPTGLALSPTGSRLYVAEWAEGRVSVFNTERMMMVGTITGLHNPRAVAVTNDGDADDADETLVVTEFFGAPNLDVSACPNGTAEVCDSGRVGRVLRFDAGDLTPLDPIELAPLDSGFEVALPAGTAAVMTSPNQLYAAAIRDGKVYVTSVSASPEPPIRFDLNVYPVVYVADLATGLEDHSNVGTANLAKLADDAVSEGTRLILQEIVDLDFDGSSSTAYVVSRAADALQRVSYDPSTGITLGTEAVKQIDLQGCQTPIGVVVAAGLRRAYVDCWINGRLAIVDLDAQAIDNVVPSVDLPLPETPEDDVRLGKRFFFTGRGRWSEGGEGYSSCGSCHPDGLSDGITWSFAAGPRQTTSLDGAFSHGVLPQKQRIFNWTAIFDETHDFERNTRGVSGGLGAITQSPSGQCGNVAEEEQLPLPADGLGKPVKEVQDGPPSACTNDWGKIDAFLQALRPPRAPLGLDLAAVERGRSVFQGDGACAVCHSGAGWTVSRRFWTPTSENNAALQVTPFEPPTEDAFWPLHTVQIAQQPSAADPTIQAVGPNEVACVLRRAGTFGSPGDTELTDLLEQKANGQRAQGAGGFNVPSLYGLAVGAPYFHHGQARTLQEVLTDPKWQAHLTAANPNFAPSSAQISDLTAFLLSIDADALEIDVPPGFDGCPASFPAFVSMLDGAQVVPPTDSGAMGTGVFFLNAGGTVLTYQVDVPDLAAEDITRVELRIAPPGFNGPVVLVLADSPASLPLRGNLDAAGLHVSADVGVTDFASFVDALEAGDAYVNIRTAANPDGEIRGQVRVPTTYLAHLDGNQVVPEVGTQLMGAATLHLSADETTLEYFLNAGSTQVVPIAGAHLNVAPPGFDGSPVLALTDTSSPSLPLQGVVRPADLIPVPDSGIVDFADFVEALQAGDVFVNVETETNPSGEIRGQVQAPIVLPALAAGTAASVHARFVIAPDRASLRFALEAPGLTRNEIEGAELIVAPLGLEEMAVLSLAEGGFEPLRIATLDEDDLIPSPEVGIEDFADLVRALLAGDGYVILRAPIEPSGEVRAPIRAPTFFGATLRGDQAVPPVSTNADGRAQFVLSADESSLRFAVETTALARPTVAETLVGDAPPGANGPTVFFLAEAGFDNPLMGTLTPADFCPLPCPEVGTFADFLDDLHGGDAYVTVTTLAHPNGELRGQLVEHLQLLSFHAQLSGDHVVPPVSTTASGFASVLLSDFPSMRVIVSFDGILPVLNPVATIHLGAVGEDGPAVFAFTGRGTKPDHRVDVLYEPDFIPVPGVAETFADFVTEMLASRAYISVGSVDHPDGEIRGQLTRSP